MLTEAGRVKTGRRASVVGFQLSVAGARRNTCPLRRPVADDR
jgi:hypothetical protein